MNFIIWSLIDDAILALPARFKEIQNKYIKESSGKETSTPRWRECEELTTKRMGMAISQKFVEQVFDITARQQAGEMISQIRNEFNELLNEIHWMDDITKKLAKEKTYMRILAITTRLKKPGLKPKTCMLLV